jgi:hypothetical protein
MLWEHKNKKRDDFNLSLTQDMEIKENTSYTDKKGNTYGVHCFKTWKYDMDAMYDCYFYFINKKTFIRIDYKVRNIEESKIFDCKIIAYDRKHESSFEKTFSIKETYNLRKHAYGMFEKMPKTLTDKIVMFFEGYANIKRMKQYIFLQEGL